MPDNAIQWDATYTYTRAQALADGYQVRIPIETSREAGIKFPVFLTRKVWDTYVVVPPGVQCQDEQGRLWDILWMTRHAITTAHSRDTSRLPVQLYVRNTNRRPRLVTLMSQVGAMDVDGDASPAITIMMQDED